MVNIINWIFLQGSNAVAEANSDDRMTMEGIYKGKEEDRAMTSDPAREGPIKAEEEGDMVRDTAKDSMDGAWMAAQDAKHKGSDGDGHDRRGMNWKRKIKVLGERDW